MHRDAHAAVGVAEALVERAHPLVPTLRPGDDLGDAVLGRPGELRPLERLGEPTPAPVAADDREAVLEEAVGHRAETGEADDVVAGERGERSRRHVATVTVQPLVERDRHRCVGRHVGIALDGQVVGQPQELGTLGQRGERDAVGRHAGRLLSR